jgi:hypothetical protein
MQRRFNYTNRKRIRKNDLSFTIVEDDHGSPKFHAGLDLTDYDLPPDAKVWVEAYDSNAIMRFPYGSVESPSNETSTVLTDFAGTDSYYFRVKVVDKEHRSRLFAVADSVSPVRHDDEDQTAKSLLRVSTRDLEHVPWKLEYPTIADHPLLVINNRIDAGKSLARSNLFFQALVLPAILEQILRRILLEDDYMPSAEPDDDDMWREGWLEFAGRLPGNSKLPIDQETSREEVVKWIDDSRNAFCLETSAVTKVRRELRELD